MFDNYQDLLNRAREASTEISNQYDNLWQNALGIAEGSVNLYGALCELGIVFAVGTSLFMILSMYKEVQEGKNAVIAQLIIPLIVGLLLFNNGSRLATFTLEIRELINNLNNNLLSTTIQTTNLNESFRTAIVANSTTDEVSRFFRQCISLNGEDLNNCLKESIQQSYSLFSIVNTVFPTTMWSAMQNNLLMLEMALSGETSTFPGLWVSPELSNLISPLIVPLWQSALFTILVAMSQGYQHAIELAMLLTALLGPLAVGGSILPLGPGIPVFAWLTGFFSLGIAKLSFNIILGLIAVVMNSQAATLDNMWFPTVLGLFAPILASALAAGGGIAIWQSIISAAQSSANNILNVIQAIPFI